MPRLAAAREGEAPARPTRAAILPPSLPPKCLSRVEAAAFVGVSPSLFDRMVAEGQMPQPKMIRSRVVWDRAKLEVYFEALPDRSPSGSFGAEGDSWADFE